MSCGICIRATRRTLVDIQFDYVTLGDVHDFVVGVLVCRSCRHHRR